MNEVKKVIWVDGGIGRVICALPAIDKLAEKEKVVVITSWKEIFANKTNIERVYKPDSEYLWEDVILKNDLVHTEPYWNSKYYRDKCHLIQAFDLEINKEMSEDVEKPELVLNSFEDNFAKKWIKDTFKNNKKTIVIQPFGSTGMFDEENNKIVDQSNRSLNLDFTEKIIDELKKEYNIVYLGVVPLKKYDIEFKQQGCNTGNCRQPSMDSSKKKDVVAIPQDLGLRGIIAIIKNSDYFLGCDSFGQHVSYGFDIPTIVFIGGTDENNICYPDKHLILKKEGFPKEYNPYRIPFNSHMIVANEGAMDFTQEEQEEFINKIKEYFKGVIE